MKGADLSCFDGSRFFFLRDYGLPAATTLDIAEDATGAIWIGTENGVYRFWNGQVAEIGKGSASSVVPISPDVVAAVMGPPGRTVADRSSVLVRFERVGGGWKAKTVAPLDSPGPLTMDRQGSLLYPWPLQGWKEIRSADVANWRSGMQLAIAHHPANYPVNAGDMKIMRDRDGCVWLGAGGGAGSNTYSCDGHTFFAPLGGEKLRADFHEAPDGTIVLRGDSVLAVGRKGSFRVAKPANGLPGLSDAVPASDGTVWLAGSTGLYRFASPFRLEYWTAREGLLPAPWSITRSVDRIYVGVTGAIMVLSADRLRLDSFAILKGGGSVTGLAGAPDGSLMVSAMAGVPIRVTPLGRGLARTDPSAYGGMRLLRTPEDEIWLSGNSLSRVVRQGVTSRLENHPLETHPSANILAIKYEPYTRKLWSCYHGGAVVRDENGRWREITTRDGLLVNDCWSLAPLANGDVWYAYMGAPAIGLIRTDSAGKVSVRQYGRPEGVTGSDAIELDGNGRLWREGTYVASPAEAETANWLKLDESDGLPAASINSGSYFNDSDGSLWWGADNDLVHYTPPDDLVTPTFAPKVFLSAFSWNGSAPRLAEAVGDLPHNATLTAHIGSLQFDRRNALRIRYRLLPEQAKWIETKSLDLPLGVLSAGAHTLEVQGRIFTGPWSGTVRRSISVMPPSWLTAPYFLTYSLAGAILFASVYLLRRKRRWEEQALMPDLGKWRLGAVMPESYDLGDTPLDGRFQVGELLARGGFASVMAGYDLVEKRRCAIKIFRSEVGIKRAWCAVLSRRWRRCGRCGIRTWWRFMRMGLRRRARRIWRWNLWRGRICGTFCRRVRCRGRAPGGCWRRLPALWMRFMNAAFAIGM